MQGKTHKIAGMCIGVITADYLLKHQYSQNMLFSIVTIGAITITSPYVIRKIPFNIKNKLILFFLIGLFFLLKKINLDYSYIERSYLTFIIIFGSIAGSLLPDIDHPNSSLGSKCKPLSKLLNSRFGHRGFIHSPILLIVSMLVLFLLVGMVNINYQIYYISLIVGIFIGWISHLLLDFITVSGIPIFYPISNKKFRILKLKTSKHDLLVAIVCLVITYLYIFL
ncbi:metal-dependent hydrolase [Clostridioides sp. ZZV14-6045]|uniref:metal-dependent hydrolase n=1 Tax=Clostridioides sp. ZZV14-6045 TaxID=2811489 RepID=UPI001D11B8CB|nr:metal-dependent hydrolase [Clostridioides sp. ZZV14-6045]